jgi:glycosyltransferase involved in cell wall biosynthesis
MPAVSVLLPCYNAAATLPEALDSLQRQTLQDIEIVAVDDGSSDATPAILAERAAADPRLKPLTAAHAGIVAALNAGLERCASPLVARMDADDRAHPERLARQCAHLDAHPDVGVVSCRVAGFPPQAVRQGFAVYLEWLNALLSDAEIRREIFIESPLPHPSLCLRREALLQVGGYQDHGWAEDYDLLLRLYLHGWRFAKLEQTLLEWREHPGRLTRVDSRYSLENFLRCKAHYLVRGPLLGRDAVFIWGAGMAGRRLGRQLKRLGAPLTAFFDIDPEKVGNTRHGLPILPPDAFLPAWRGCQNPVVLGAVGARGARPLVRRRFEGFGLQEGVDWWGVA